MIVSEEVEATVDAFGDNRITSRRIVFGPRAGHAITKPFLRYCKFLALLALGLALAHLKNHGPNLRFKLAIAASAVLALGIALTAMRTVLIAFAIGVCRHRAARSSGKNTSSRWRQHCFWSWLLALLLFRRRGAKMLSPCRIQASP